jgi:hypothetical protein
LKQFNRLLSLAYKLVEFAAWSPPKIVITSGAARQLSWFFLL